MENVISPKISIVSPVYQAEDIVFELVNRITSVMNKDFQNEYEVILVDDGSADSSWNKIEKLCQTHSYVKGVKLSRNFGQHSAITAGLIESQGESVVVMDCDLQDDPSEIPNLLKKREDGFDIVLAQRTNRQDKPLKKIFSKFFYKFFGFLTGTTQDSSIANFGVYSRQSVDAILSMGDHSKYLPTMCQWVGFEITKVKVIHKSRLIGETSYSFQRMLSLALSNMVTFSDKPLWLIVKVGFSIACISFLIALIFLYHYLSGDVSQPGFTSIILSIWFLGGFLMVMIGLVGIYVGKIFDQVKNRPTFIIKTKLNFEHISKPTSNRFN